MARETREHSWVHNVLRQIHIVLGVMPFSMIFLKMCGGNKKHRLHKMSAA